MAQVLPFKLSIAPFPEGFQGDMDETFQQAYQNTTAVVEGNFITGLVLPPNSTLPTTDQGPIAMNETWYFWDPTTSQYLPQTSPFKAAKNFARNSCYQIQQQGSTFTLAGGITQTYDLAIARATGANVLAIASDVGPVAGADNDLVPSAIKYTVGPSLATTLAATDIYAHEHLIEGSDIVMLQGQMLALSFSVYATVAGAYSVYIANGGRDRSYTAQFSISASQINQWIRVKIINIPAMPTSSGTWSFSDGVTGLYIGFPMAIGTQWQTANLNVWNNAFYGGSASNINMCTVVNNQLKITAIKLEASAGTTFYQTPAFAADFEELQRYYFTTYDYQSSTTGIWMTFVSGVAGQATGNMLFPRRMCKVPTVVPYSASTNAAGTLFNATQSTNPAVAAIGGFRKGAGHNAAVPAAAKGDVLLAYIRADARFS